jgi:hypothetical protein
MSLYVFKDGQNLGPYDDDAVLQSLRNGAFRPEELASRNGQGDWRPLSFFFPLPEHQASEARTEMFQTGQTEVRQTDPFQQYQPPPAPLQQYQQPYQPVPVMGGGSGNDRQHEQLASISWGLGIASLVLMLVGLVPCLGWLNWFTLVVGLGAVITGAIVMSQSLNEKIRSSAQLGLILASVALVIGFFRLVIGAGCI